MSFEFDLPAAFRSFFGNGLDSGENSLFNPKRSAEEKAREAEQLRAVEKSRRYIEERNRQFSLRGEMEVWNENLARMENPKIVMMMLTQDATNSKMEMDYVAEQLKSIYCKGVLFCTQEIQGLIDHFKAFQRGNNRKVPCVFFIDADVDKDVWLSLRESCVEEEWEVPYIVANTKALGIDGTLQEIFAHRYLGGTAVEELKETFSRLLEEITI